MEKEIEVIKTLKINIKEETKFLEVFKKKNGYNDVKLIVGFENGQPILIIKDLEEKISELGYKDVYINPKIHYKKKRITFYKNDIMIIIPKDEVKEKYKEEEIEKYKYVSIYIEEAFINSNEIIHHDNCHCTECSNTEIIHHDHCQCNECSKKIIKCECDSCYFPLYGSKKRKYDSYEIEEISKDENHEDSEEKTIVLEESEDEESEYEPMLEEN